MNLRLFHMLIMLPERDFLPVFRTPFPNLKISCLVCVRMMCWLLISLTLPICPAVIKCPHPHLPWFIYQAFKPSRMSNYPPTGSRINNSLLLVNCFFTWSIHLVGIFAQSWLCQIVQFHLLWHNLNSICMHSPSIPLPKTSFLNAWKADLMDLINSSVFSQCFWLLLF